MNGHIMKLGLLVVTLLSAASLHAQDAAPLSHNPFARPPSTATIEARPSLEADGSVRMIDLRATMVMGDSSLANVGGRILRPGDDVDGYTLLQVQEDRAIFSRGGKRLTIFVKPELEDDDE